MEIVIVVVVVGALFYFFVIRRGNLSFWKKAAKNPDFVYKRLTKDSAWIIDDESVAVDKKAYDGPFFLYIPSLNRTVKFYGKIGEYERSQGVIAKDLDSQ